MAKKVNFLSNKEILKEIHKSKNTYCYYVDPVYSDYDDIVYDLKDITEKRINECREKRVANLVAEDKLKQKEQGLKNYQIKSLEMDLTEIDVNAIVFRVMTCEHIPLLDEDKIKGNPKRREDLHVRTNFPPFKHYVCVYEGDSSSKRIDMSKLTFKEVGRSHWVGGLENGHFSMDHGNITDRLARMYMLLVERYSQKPNWRGYSYLEEMKSQSLLQLIQVGLKFDESRSQNPFSYYTTTMTNSFTGIFHKEKRVQTIRDDILIMQGQNPSNTRLTEHELDLRTNQMNPSEPSKKAIKKTK